MSPKANKDGTFTLPRLEGKDTKAFAKFGVPWHGESSRDEVNGVLYVPLDLAKGVTSITVTLNK